MNTSQKVVVITGASSGMGLDLTRAFLSRGDLVVATARNEDKLKSATQSLPNSNNLTLVSGDIGAEETADVLFEAVERKHGRVDVLINNAGIYDNTSFAAFQTDALDKLVRTNLYGFFFVTRAAVRLMQQKQRGVIINVTAAIAIQPLTASPSSVQVMVKGAVNQATKALAIELAPQNIRVNAIAPGIINTPLHDPNTHAFLNSLQPLGRIGDVGDISDAALFLADSDFVTGVILPIDGGITAGR
ncbi:3-oxoacyl-ACP reductase [Burkholderia cepacia]|uniref:3-oxoacyl-ACP reductase n=1 Tax=Burkholderia cepacia TaxID=292 RepID=A0A103ZJ24_BURCE|nr:SDR family oxidoreductase [Burkholderia cepacia]KVK80953.1 3-oxoacyl-ACP reductase [Burkholderia cepacia]